MTNFRVFFQTTLFVFFCIVAVHLAVLIIVDPLNISQFKLLKNEFHIREMRFQSASIINNEDFDSAIIGSSMAANFNATEASQLLNGKFKNLSLDGSLLKERKVVLDYLFQKKDIKTLIISIDGATQIQRNKGIPLDSWSYLYDQSRLNDYYVYLNTKYMDYLNCHSLLSNNMISMIFGDCPRHKIRTDIDDLTEWQSEISHNSRFGGIDKWLQYQQNSQIAYSIGKINQVIRERKKDEEFHQQSVEVIYAMDEFKQNLSVFFQEYKNTRFILYFPPYSIFNYALDASISPAAYKKFKQFVKAVVLEAELYSNVEMYWFADQAFAKDIANYKDLTHYSSEYNSHFINEFKNQESRIHAFNYQYYLDTLDADVKTINLIEFAKSFNRK